MFFLYLSFVCPISHSLNEINASYIINNTERYPVFIKLWATWCHHCKSFNPVWEELSSNEYYNDKVLFAEIECESNRKLCNTFEGQNFPRVYWYDISNHTFVRYHGERTISHINRFIEKQMRFPLIEYNETMHDSYTSSLNISTIFHFKIPKDDQKSLEIAKQVATLFRGSESRFFISNTPESLKPQLESQISPEISEYYSGEWTVGALFDFVVHRSLPFHTDMNGYVLKHLETYSISSLVSVNRGNYPNYSTSIPKHFASRFITSKINCTASQWFCRYTSIDKGDTAQLFVLFDWKARLFWVYEGENTIDGISSWFASIDSKSIRGSGPGTGLLSNVLQAYYDQKASGQTGSTYLMFIPMIIAVFLIFCTFDSTPKLKKLNIKPKTE